MNLKRKTSLLLLLMVIIVAGCTGNNSFKKSPSKQKTEITISAAASLSAALAEIKLKFARTNSNIAVTYNLGGTGTLEQQIIQGAPVDIFLSAAKAPFRTLVQKGYIDKRRQTDLLRNQLVLITNKTTPAPLKSFQELGSNSIEKIAIGIPETVPAGMYAMQTLKKLQIWNQLEPKLVQTKDVRQVLTYVETNSVDAGIVYITDAKASNKVKVVDIAPDNTHEPIIYSAGIIMYSTKKKAAAKFYDFLKTKTARNVFEKYGFTVLD